MPEAVTEKLAVAPSVTVVFDGWLVIAGAVAFELTVNVALLLVALPTDLVTVQR